MKWLENVMPPKFYRYIFHKMVIMAVKFRNSDPCFSSTILMSMTTIHQLFFIVFGIGVLIKVDIFGAIMKYINIITIIIFALLFMYIHYLLFYYKKKYIRIMEEFKNETPKQTKIGMIYLFIYIIVGTLVLFALWGWFLTINNPKYS